ncbi:hypothetical protein [Helicobacter sp. T3_23-1059]
MRAIHIRLFMLFFALHTAPLCAIPYCYTQAEERKQWGGTIMQVLALHTMVGGDFGAQTLPKSNQNPPQNLAQNPAQNTIDSTLNWGVGTSLGLNYMNPDNEREFDYGWRVRYGYMATPSLERVSHLIGAFVYLHPSPNPYHRFLGAIQTHKDCQGLPDGYPTPFSFVLGTGAIITKNPYGYAQGGYIEAGIAFFKWFPFNAELIYRISFYPPNIRQKHIEEITHSLNVVFNIF